MTALLVDIGNTRVKWRFVDGGDAALDGNLPSADSDGLAALWERERETRVASVCVSNVATVERTVAIERLARTLWPDAPFDVVVSRPRQCGVINGYVEPAQLGTDRWMAAIAAHRLEPDAPVLVCGFGTATTIDLLVPSSADEATFVGGLIVPGIETMHRSLARDTARLSTASGAGAESMKDPMKDLEPDFAVSTRDAIGSGIVAAQVGAVAEAVRRATRLTHDRVPLRGILAGGHAARIAPHLDPGGPHFTIVPDLVLRGLGLVADDLLDRRRRLA